jgi:hypothetical protein
MTKKVDVFDISSVGAQRLEELKNNPNIRITNENEYFGIGGGEDGPVPFVYRSVDYEEVTPNVLTGDAAYRMPIC